MTAWYYSVVCIMCVPSSLGHTGGYLNQNCDAVIDRCLKRCIVFRGVHSKHSATTAAPITRGLDNLASALEIHSDIDCLFFAKTSRSCFTCQIPREPQIGLRPNNSRAWVSQARVLKQWPCTRAKVRILRWTVRGDRGTDSRLRQQPLHAKRI